MNKQNIFKYLWWGWLAYFGATEGYAIYDEVTNTHNDGLTFTHFAASQMPISLRAAFIAWLAYHFLIEHKKG